MNIKLQIFFFVLTSASSFFIFLGLIWAIVTEKRLKRFFLGKKGKDIEDAILALENNIMQLKKANENIEKDIVVITEKLKKNIRGLEIVRFNPFPDQGSNQSFAIGMLNEENNGLVISSLYSRERMSVFAKPVKNGKSPYELTLEEKEVLEKAKI